MGQHREERRLTTILAADVVGYSRLMAADERETLAQLKAHRRELIEPKTADYGGRVVKLVGDGTLMEFASVVDAVNFAIDVQAAMVARNQAVPEERQIVYRMGINIGDIIVEGDDIYGDGVNIAARLEGLAEPGGICVARNVFEQVRTKVAVGFEDLGEQRFKNIPEPVHALNLRSYGSDAGPPRVAVQASSTLDLPDKPSIVVLPFVNLSRDPEQDYFADGITEDIITELSQFRSLFVIARNSAFSYKGQAVKVQDLGRDLGVHYVVEGSIRKAANRIRVNAQLVEAATGNHAWAKRYDRDLEDIFAVQDELTQAIVAAVPGRLEAADLERAKRKSTANLVAYDYLLRGKDHHHQFTQEDNAKALESLHKAIELDPDYGQAHAWLSCTYGQAWVRGYLEDRDLAWERCVGAAQKAYALDENDSECHRILSAIYLNHKEYGQAEFHHERSFALNPNDPLIVSQHGYLRAMLGDPEAGVEWITKAMRLDPYRPDLFGNNLGIALFSAKRYQEALTALQHITTVRYPHHAYMAACDAALGRPGEAKAQVAEVLKVKPDFSAATFAATMPYRLESDQDHLRDCLIKAGCPD